MDFNLGSHLRILYSEYHLHQLPEKEALLPAWSPLCSNFVTHLGVPLSSRLARITAGTSKAPLSHRSKNTPSLNIPSMTPPSSVSTQLYKAAGQLTMSLPRCQQSLPFHWSSRAKATLYRVCLLVQALPPELAVPEEGLPKFPTLGSWACKDPGTETPANKYLLNLGREMEKRGITGSLE